jgi:hypothetical protein
LPGRRAAARQRLWVQYICARSTAKKTGGPAEGTNQSAEATSRARKAGHTRPTMSPPLSFGLNPSAARPLSRWGALGWAASLLVQALLFWALAAALLASAMPGLGSFGRLLLISECIGVTMLASAALFARWLRPRPLARPWRLVFAWLPALPIGYVLGHVVAFTLLGEPAFLFGRAPERMAPILFTLLTAGLGLLYFATRYQLAHEHAQREHAQALAAQSELRLLRAQLEPHMLFNTLANLRSLVEDDGPQALAMLDRLIAYLRGVLAGSRTEATSLQAEFEQLRAYLDLMCFRMGPRLSYRLDLPADLQQHMLPAMLLQPLVENAIKHGIEPKVGPGRVEVLAYRAAAGIEIVVTDTGPAWSPALPEQQQSYGLEHVRQRLASRYGAAAMLSLHNDAGAGTHATVRIPS